MAPPTVAYYQQFQLYGQYRTVDGQILAVPIQSHVPTGLQGAAQVFPNPAFAIVPPQTAPVIPNQQQRNSAQQQQPHQQQQSNSQSTQNTD